MLGREQTVELWILILSGWSPRQEVCQLFQISSHEFQTVPDVTTTDLLQFLSGLLVL